MKIFPCNHPIQLSYNSMMDRCYSEKHQRNIKNYGKRGIVVCDKWIDNRWEFVGWAYESGWQKGLTLERTDNNGPYAPWNCRWATPREQARNRRSNRIFSAFEETKTLIEWSEDSRCVVTYQTLYTRVNKLKWALDKALVTLKQEQKGKSGSSIVPQGKR